MPSCGKSAVTRGAPRWTVSKRVVGRGLTGSIGSEKAEKFAATHLEADALHGPRAVGINLGEIAHVNNGFRAHAIELQPNGASVHSG